jgi:8-oxo-dGTP diphosphatase
MGSGKQTVQVVAAVVVRGDRYLITQRMAKAVFPLYWEFPGGKVEPGEDDATALRREMREELDVDVEVGDLLGQTLHEYEMFLLDFRVYRCQLAGGELKPLNVADIRWVTTEELGDYPFPPADEAAIADLVAGDAARKAG